MTGDTCPWICVSWSFRSGYGMGVYLENVPCVNLIILVLQYSVWGDPLLVEAGQGRGAMTDTRWEYSCKIPKKNVPGE